MAKIAFSFERLYGQIFLTNLGETFFVGFFPGFFFLRPRRKYTGKKTRRNTVNENSSKIPVHKDVRKIMQDVGSRRPTPKSAKLICYSILKNQS